LIHIAQPHPNGVTGIEAQHPGIVVIREVPVLTAVCPGRFRMLLARIHVAARKDPRECAISEADSSV
jgi:hypothetical protein